MGYKLKRILIHPGGVEKQVRPKTWQPGANTIAYFPLTEDQLDKVGNISLPLTGTKGDIGYTFNVGRDAGAISNTNNVAFMSVWIKYNSGLGSEVLSPYLTGYFGYNFAHSSYSFRNCFQYQNANGSWYSFGQTTISSNVWHLLSLGWDGTTYYAYVDGELKGTATNTRSATNCGIGNYINITLSEIILENKVRTAQEVSSYYNSTKGSYGL